MKRKNRNEAYKSAILISFLVHLFFMTSAEAALFFSKSLTSSPSFSLMTSWQAVQSSSPVKTFSPHTPALVVKIPEYKPTEIMNPQMLEETKQFYRDQSRLNQKIKFIKKNLIKKQIKLLQSVGSSVYDMEKVPVDIRKSVLPEYLRNMRLKISAEWLSSLRSVRCESCMSIVKYKISQSGEIFDLQLLNPSQDKKFDSTCLKAVRRSSPLSALPFDFDQEIKANYLTVSLSFYLEKKKPKTVLGFPF